MVHAGSIINFPFNLFVGKWFNYGIIFIVMILDMNMWKNQMFYKPYNYGQYEDPDTRKVKNQTHQEKNILRITVASDRNRNKVLKLRKFEGTNCMKSYSAFRTTHMSVYIALHDWIMLYGMAIE